MSAQIVQGTPEWFAARLGKATASRVADIVARTKTGYAASRENYMVELTLERLTGQRQEGFTSSAMAWGVANEPFGRGAYEARTGEIVEEVGLIDHPRIPNAAASPDGLVGEDGLIEIKCPNSATHIRTIRAGVPEARYLTQMQWQMACTNRQWCDFVSFDPRMPQGAQLWIKRYPRDQACIDFLEQEVEKFLQEVAATTAFLLSFDHT